MSTLHVVIGAGPLGSSVARSLLERGESVRIVSRSGARPVDGAEALASDVNDPVGAAAAVAGANVVYQCAQPAYHRWAEEFPALQASILTATAAAGASIVIADNLYSYGDPAGSTITEATPENPSSLKGAVRRDMARDALAAHAEGRLRVALTRPANYFGPRYDQTGKTVFAKAAAGRAMQFLGSADQPHSFSYVPDAGAAMATIGTSEAGWGRAWITPVQPAMTQAEFAERIWHVAGQSGTPRASYIGAGMLRFVGLFSATTRAVVEMMYEYTAPFVVSSAQFESEFGSSATPIDEAIAATLRAYSPA